MDNDRYALGSLTASEQLISDLYIDLRRKVNLWAGITKQTAQARMGYVGQHLVSVATGYPGGRSGARGYDLVISDSQHGEIKTCYRVDQLGKCLSCETPVASIETECPNCGSTDIERKQDSKWLIGIRNDDEFAAILTPEFYYLVLFDFVDFEAPNEIQASIWRVDPRTPGFGFCMVDYYLNIRANSRSKAPFNLWPYQLKFYLMRPVLIYQSVIQADDTITTRIFPGRDTPVQEPLSPLDRFARSRNLTPDVIRSAGQRLGIFDLAKTAKKPAMLTTIDRLSLQAGHDQTVLTDAFASALYLPDIDHYTPQLPEPLRSHITQIKATQSH